MKRTFLSLLFIFICINVAYTQTVFKEYIDGRVYVKFSKASLKGISRENPSNISLSKFENLKNLFSKYGVTKIYKPFYQADDDDILSSILKIEFTQVKNIEAFIGELALVKNVEYAEKVHLNKADVVPNDPLFATTNGSTHLTQINAQAAWNIFNGNSNITVAIVDNAVMSTHVDLAGNIYTNTIEANGVTGVDDDGNGYVDDINGYDVAGMDGVTNPTNTAQDHGTHCSGIAGANTNNSIGVASIGWNIKIIPVKCSYDNSLPANIDAGYEGILYAVRAKAKIISCSWGNMGSPSQTEQYVIDYAWNRGSIIFAAAGNASSNSQNYPGAYNNVFCVASVDPSDVKSSFSNYGTWVDIAAPGNSILSTVPYTSTPAYVPYNGTSMATPMVAGLAGLMLSKSPGMTRTDVLNCLSNTAVNIYSLSGNSSFVSGNQIGAGRIDAFAAMTCAASYSAIPPLANFYAFLPSTCPNTSIPFIDSSLYNPTSWSWTFQGGTPATSTSSNPSVLWTTAGTYSVSLTATNANGSNTKTKLSYVTVAGPLSLPFSEGFQSAAFLPLNWVANNISNDNLYWQRNATLGGFGTSSACAMFDNFNMNAPGERDEMRTPKFNFSSVATASLTFDVAYARYDANYSDSLEVKMSTNCGSTWSTIYFKGGTSLATAADQLSQFIPSNTQWRTDAINISAITAGQGNVMFSFLNHGHYGQAIYLDNINLVFPTPTLSANNTASICINPSYTFTNTSLSAANYTWNFQGGSPASSTASNPSVSYATPGTYTLTMTGINGTTTASLTKTITILPNPTVTASSGTFCAGNSYTIIGSGVNVTTYTWTSASGSTPGPNLVFTPLASSFFTLTGGNGFCTSQSIATINVVQSPTVTVSSQTICAGSSATLLAGGASSYSWNTSATTNSIIVSPGSSNNYTVTGTTAPCAMSKTVSITVTPQLTLSLAANPAVKCAADASTLTAGGASSYSWNSVANSSSIIVSPLVTTTYTLTGNSGACTATALTTISVTPTPTLNISSSVTGTVCAGTVVTLNGSGAGSYSWSSGATGSSVQVTPSATSIYTLTGTNQGCSITKTVSIAVGASTISVSILVTPTAVCVGVTATLTANGASSYSWSVGSTSNSIIVNPSITTIYSLTGANGVCSTSTFVTLVPVPNPLSVVSTSNSVCNSPCSGIANATSTGGSGPFIYSLSNSSCTTLPCANLCQGLYTLHTTNSSGCNSSDVFSISSPAAVQSVLTITNTACSTCATGILSANVVGGTAPYNYTWAPSGGNAATAQQLLPGCYTVTIADANGCASSTNACVSISTGLQTLTLNTKLLIYPNPAKSSVTIELTGAEFNCTVYNNLGQLIFMKKINQDLYILDLSEFAKGVYLIEVESGSDKVRRKLLVE